MTSIIPGSRPNQPREMTDEILRKNGVTDPVVLLGVRGYYCGTEFNPSENLRGVYDDAIFLVTPTKYLTFNANTDPSGYRPGHGNEDAGKGMATLCPQVVRFKLGLHKGKTPALLEAGMVHVLRDADSQVPEHFIIKQGERRFYKAFGNFGIDLHPGGIEHTGSLGCQTIPPSEWAEFYAECESAMKRAGMETINYLLVEKGSA